MTNYVFIYNDSGELKTDLITDENFDTKSILKNIESEIFIINNKKFKVVNIYHFINSYIYKMSIELDKPKLSVIYDSNGNIIDWITLLDVIDINHSIDIIDETIKLIILNKIT